MALHGPTDSSGRLVQGTTIYVDASWAGANENGSPEAPYTTIAAGLAAAATGDEILIRAGAYTEDLTLVNGVDLIAVGDEGVVITGTATGTDVSCVLKGISFVDDGAGSALDIAGTAAREIRMIDCLLTSTATGDQVMTALNTAQTLILERCELVANAANANEALLIGQGTVTLDDCIVTHGNAALDAVLCSGAAAATVNIFDCRITGSIESAAAVVAPVVSVRGGWVTCGAVSAGIIAAGCTQSWSEVFVTSTDAGNNAFDGAGNLNRSQLSFGGTATAAAGTLTVADQVSTVQKLHPVNVWYVDIAYAGGENYGSELLPFAAIQDAIDAANAGDLILVAPGAYTEDLALAADVDIRGRCGPLSGAVVVTGTCTVTDASCSISDINFIDDGAGVTVHLTGVGADAMTLSGCTLTSTATGDAALSADNTNLTLTAFGCRFQTEGANANQTVQLESGTFDFNSCDFTHATTTNEVFVAEGDAATTITCHRCNFTGSVQSEAAAVNPAMSFYDCRFVVGAVSCLVIAGGNTVIVKDPVMTSTDAANDAVDGTGTLTIYGEAYFTAAADELATTLTVTHALGSRIQHGNYTEAAGAGARAITFAQPFPDANVNVICDGPWYASAILATGFTLNTTGNATQSWVAIHI